MDLVKLKEVFLVFLKLGCIAFGGPAAHIAMMEEELVKKRKWITQQHFLDMVGATNLVPGPNSTQMTMYCGHARAGWLGLLVGGMSFIIPAVFFTLVLAIIYGEYGEVPAIAPFFFGIKPAVIGIIVSACYKLGKKAFKNWQLATLGTIVMGLSIFGLDEFTLIIGGGLLGMFGLHYFKRNQLTSVFAPILLLAKPLAFSLTSSSIFLSFLKIAMVLFGGGYVLIAYIDAELVEKLGWLTKAQLLDAIAMGQFTPGPILTTATFVGYQLNGIAGALWASLGMFLPSFFLVGWLVKIIPLLKKSAMLSKFLDAVNGCAVGIMIAVTLKLGFQIGTDWQGASLMALSIAVAFVFPKVSALWVILGGSVLGYLLLLLI
ncbi:MAG: chromate efflux transporter [Flavobacteriales bacterium]|nr:chromate efflux transporter [Flavobacteriales bacterium]